MSLQGTANPRLAQRAGAGVADRTQDRERAIVAAIVCSACAIRLPGLAGDGLWRDQANLYVQLTAPDFGEFFARMTATEWHPPLYFLLGYGWAKLAGTSELALTIVPFACSIATVALVIRLGTRLASFPAGAVAGLLYALAPLPVAYAGEYLYPLMGLLSTLAALLVVRARDEPLTAPRYARLALSALLAVATHYGALIYVPLLATWALAGGGPLRRRLGVASALALGLLPFALWLPVFLAQRHIGVPYYEAPSIAARSAFFIRALGEFVPVRPLAAQLAFVACVLAAVIAVVRAGTVRRRALEPAFVFGLTLAVIAAANLTATRYALPYYGLACASLGWLFASAAEQTRSVSAPLARLAVRVPATVLACAFVGIDIANAVGSAAIPKSGIRSIAHSPAKDAATLYVIAPDYLASTFAFYARGTPAVARGFVRWEHPEVFRLAGYAADWQRPAAVEDALERIARSARGRSIVDVVVDDRARDSGALPYGKVRLLLRALGARYRLLDRTPHAGRYEAVSEYRYRRGSL